MSEITRHGPRFTFLVGFDLGKPRVSFTKFMSGSYSLTLGYIEFLFLFGAGRDRMLDALNKGIEVMKPQNLTT